jgi:hypothetical protein
MLCRILKSAKAFCRDGNFHLSPFLMQQGNYGERFGQRAILR